jgi:hypothetical protein
MTILHFLDLRVIRYITSVIIKILEYSFHIWKCLERYVGVTYDLYVPEDESKVIMLIKIT